MPRRSIRLLPFVLCLSLATMAGAADGGGLVGLRNRLGAHLTGQRFAAAAWGVKVVSLETGATLFERNAHKLLKPASNAKLYTGALALDRLGPDFRIKTSLHAHSLPDRSGTLRGDLLVFGRGDPTFAARFLEGDYSGLLDSLTAALAAAGVKRIGGDLVADESFFRGSPLGFGWAWDDLQHYYGAEASALTVQDNVVDLEFRPGRKVGEPCRITTLPSTSFLVFSNRTVTAPAGMRRAVDVYRPVGGNTVYVSGSMAVDDTNALDAVAVPRPAQWFASMLKEALVRRGIPVKGRARAVDWLEREIAPLDLGKLAELGAVESRPLSEIVTRMMKPSQNLYAHLLLLQAGARRQARQPETARMSTEDAGLAELRAFLAEAGVPAAEVLLEEGSGLSRGALVTPNATVSLLQVMHRHRWAEAFRASLPVAGVDGTLRRRMKGTVAEGNVRAKTGTLRYVFTLSGYVTTMAGEPLAFSLMLNNYAGGETSGRAALDSMAVMLAELEEKTGP